MIDIIQNRMTAIISTTMGHSQTEKTRNHDRIVEVAARRIREVGTEAPGVAEIMAGAGLTHGGFYKHFGSRDELIAGAAEHTYAESEAAAQQVIDGADDPLAAFVDWYLSSEHRDHPGSGCSVVALGNDVARASDEVRSAYTGQVRRYLARLDELLGTDETRRPSADARVALSTLAGALLVARAVDDPELSEQILRDARAALVANRAALVANSSPPATPYSGADV
jgi:TetR/AcrR family transcriptional regulator, transcriptional repressor for nem operon